MSDLLTERDLKTERATEPPKRWRNWFDSLTGRWSSGATGPQPGSKLWPSKDLAETAAAGWEMHSNWRGKVKYLGAFPDGEAP